MKKIIYLIIAVATLSSCSYEFAKYPNTKRVKKKDVKKAMEYSSWEYDARPTQPYNTTYKYNH